MSKKSLPKGIRLSKSGKFLVDVCVNGVRKTATCATLDDARRSQLELKGVIAAVENQGLSNFDEPVKRPWTIKEACDYMFDTRWRTVKSRVTCETKVKAIYSYFGTETPITSITSRSINDFISFLQGKFKAGSVKLYVSGLGAILRVMLECGELDKLPIFPKIKNPAKRIRYFTHEDEARILEHFSTKPDVQDAVMCLLDTGMRCNELLSLKTKDIDFNTNMITIWVNKTDKPRSVPMTSRVREVMLRRSELRIKGQVFDLNYTNLCAHWAKMRDTLFPSQQDVVLHTLRHTCCSRLIQKGATLPSVMLWMGHSSVQTTMIYAHLAPDTLSSMIHLLEEKKDDNN